MRREFRLPEEDEEFLNALGLPWEAVVCGRVNWLLIEFPVPAGYTHAHATLAVRIVAAYPPGKLDMAYFYPQLARADGKTIKGVTTEQIDGKGFQRWSRHYQWMPGEHNLSTHVGCVEHWLASELQKG
jgi:hypothetical protein